MSPCSRTIFRDLRSWTKRPRLSSICPGPSPRVSQERRSAGLAGRALPRGRSKSSLVRARSPERAVFGRAPLFEASLVQSHDAIHPGSQALIVSRYESGTSLSAHKREKLGEDCIGGAFVEIARRLVGENKRRLVRK